MRKGDDIVMFILLAAGAAWAHGKATLAHLRRTVEWPRAGWVWPLPILRMRDGTIYPPVISSGVGDPRPGGIHRGVDVMYRRRSSIDRPEYPKGTRHGSPMHFAPGLIPVLAARDGVIWSAGKTGRGWSVVLDHGKPWATYYTHLDALLVSPHKDGRNALGQSTRVRAGEPLGFMGADPMDPAGLVHLHFSVAHNGAPESAAIDPAREMPRWPRSPKVVEVVG